MGSDGLFANAEWLETEQNHGYGLLPIPTKRDEEITSLLRAWADLNPADRERASKALRPTQVLTLLGYSERMASLAVRRKDREILRLGLLALGLSGWRGDQREGLMVLSLFFDAAQRLGMLPSDLFADIARLLSAEVGVELRAFLSRAPEDRSVEAMGYHAGKDVDGFRYEYDGWPQ